MKNLLLCFKLIGLLCITALIFSLGFARVEGDSMKPKLENDDIIIYKKNKNGIKRFDIVIAKVKNELFIKRVIGLPGEKIEYVDSVLYINDIKIDESFQKSITKDFSINDIITDNVIPNNKILVLGDNRLYSHDSREFGLIDVKDIKGIFWLKIL